MDVHGRKPEFSRSDNGGQFAANDVMAWLNEHMVGPTFVDPGCLWQNGFVESFHGKFRDECLNREWFKSIQEATIVIEQWRAVLQCQATAWFAELLDTSRIRRPARSHVSGRVQHSLLSGDYHFD
ncbi:integrase core domain-containing protein [Candidatus Roseilinea sp. NK_OTU-006]|jgi:transposase InsO family protein|uniref:integrase core domain-containing protein n=1 Tax=Candidatus Roseilinea sp. NK_OTU-006 TaxID=2704250 RepID=UPI001F0A5F9B|nr:integrase core domain-containing protein [Candidatus Roseilinea sp. NK_OTU-006]